MRQSAKYAAIAYLRFSGMPSQVDFTERKSSHTSIELSQRPSRMPRERPVDYQVLLCGSHYCYTYYMIRIDYFQAEAVGVHLFR